jgi:hypothetical protein
MKIRNLFLGLLLAAAPAFAQSYSKVVFTWTAGSPLWPACSGTVTTSCTVGQTITDITVPATPVVISSTISATALTYTETPFPSPGVHTWSLVVNFAVGAPTITSVTFQ